MPALSTPAPTEIPLPRLLAVMVPAMLLVPIAADMVSLVLPFISEQFGASTAAAAWVVTGFLLVCAVGIPIYGRVADLVSIRGLFTVALAIFAFGALACAIAPNLVVLVGGRIAMGAGGAAIPVLTIIAAARLTIEGQAPLAIGVLGAAGGVGTAAGPVVGGIVGQALGWRGLFWLVMALAVVLVPAVRFVVTDRSPGRKPTFDLLGGLLLGASAGLTLLGITTFATVGFDGPSSWCLLAAGLASAVLFAWRSRVVAEPFVPPSLLRGRGYRAVVGVIFLAMVINLATLVLVPVLVIDVNGLTPAQGSLVMIPGGIALALVSPFAGRLGQRGVNAGTLCIVGLSLITLAAALLSLTAGRAAIIPGAAVLAAGAGFALVVTSATSAVSTLLPPEQIGVGIGIFQGAQFLGAGVGPALLGAMLVARQSSAAPAFNPLYDGSVGAFSDVFLLLAIVGAAGLVVAARLRSAITARGAVGHGVRRSARREGGRRSSLPTQRAGRADGPAQRRAR